MRTIVLEELTATEKLDLIGELWDSLADQAVELSPAQMAEIDDRLDALDPDAAAPWQEVETRLKQRLR
jgi:putative addiction module component (TIGR02574 family)